MAMINEAVCSVDNPVCKEGRTGECEDTGCWEADKVRLRTLLLQTIVLPVYYAISSGEEDRE